ncbi:hypothetical protein SAY87_017510 [Trapa incisa]|uniref:Uncharacterized protein n=1 Tax=Trapa incisa TaxID=236973 RepID=A0AAN7L6M5_9MYRT|nr:hypothetical protein SAY87_017510 [Trapa incisa]
MKMVWSGLKFSHGKLRVLLHCELSLRPSQSGFFREIMSAAAPKYGCGRLISDPEAGEGAVVMVMVVMMMEDVVFAADKVMDAPELLNVAGDADGALLVEAELLLRLLEEAAEQRVVDVHHRYHEPLTLLPLTHQNPYAALWHVPQLSLALVAVAVAVEEEVEIETQEMVMVMGLLRSSHGAIFLKGFNCGQGMARFFWCTRIFPAATTVHATTFRASAT